MTRRESTVARIKKYKDSKFRNGDTVYRNYYGTRGYKATVLRVIPASTLEYLEIQYEDGQVDEIPSYRMLHERDDYRKKDE